MATTTSPSIDEEASQLSPDLENDSLEIISVLVSICIPSKVKVELWRQATASYTNWLRKDKHCEGTGKLGPT
jgi:hypothetical protein